ncbi:MAG TPA: 50S ribosomal protein L28 [Alphaproteobacteria bacterium]|nr:50S ribosomal protein L28 [Alphaproteobacteria bacterium]
MARRCQLSGTGALRGMHVSHAHNRNPRHYQVNLQPCSLYSDALGRTVRMRVAAATLRTVDHRGGLDAYLAKARANELTAFGRRLKNRIAKAAAQAE